MTERNDKPGSWPGSRPLRAAALRATGRGTPLENYRVAEDASSQIRADRGQCRRGRPVTDPRAHALRQCYEELFGGEALPVPVESIAEDLLGLSVDEAELRVSGVCSLASAESW